MNTKRYRVLQSFAWVALSCVTSLGAAKGFADRFRDYVLQTPDATTLRQMGYRVKKFGLDELIRREKNRNHPPN